MGVIERITICDHCGREPYNAEIRPGSACTIPGCDGVFRVYVPTTTSGAAARADEAERQLRVFQSGLTDVLRAYNVPAMPTWAEALHWLARHGGQR